jgi:pyruvate formate lyase activating enzyme
MNGMKGIIFDIKKYAIHDGPGIRTTVFFKGCPLNCRWCHNPEGIKGKPETFDIKFKGSGYDLYRYGKKNVVGRIVSADEVMEEIIKDKIFYDQSGGGMTFSGGEPMMQIDFLTALLRECKSAAINSAVDTCGYVPLKDLKRIADLVDIVLYDIKIIDDDLHQEYTGVSNKIILGNLVKLAEWGKTVTIRIPAIPGITDTQKNLGDIADYLSHLKNVKEISILPYNRLAEDKCRRFKLKTKLERLKIQTENEIAVMADLFASRGFSVTIGG